MSKLCMNKGSGRQDFINRLEASFRLVDFLLFKRLSSNPSTIHF
jgi:hypothetical protein